MLIFAIVLVFLKILFCHQQIDSSETTDMSSSERIKYPCGQCGKQFSWKNGLFKHLRAVHEGVKYSCGQCGKDFYLKASLAEHNR